MNKFFDELLSLEDLCKRCGFDIDEAEKAVTDMVGEDISIADEHGESWVTRRDGFKIVAALTLKKVGRFTPAQVKKVMADHNIDLNNREPILRLVDDSFLVIKLRLKDLRSSYITMLEK